MADERHDQLLGLDLHGQRSRSEGIIGALPCELAGAKGLSEGPIEPKHSLKLERAAGIEPAWPAWKAGTLPLSYARNGQSS